MGSERVEWKWREKNSFPLPFFYFSTFFLIVGGWIQTFSLGYIKKQWKFKWLETIGILNLFWHRQGKWNMLLCLKITAKLLIFSIFSAASDYFKLATWIILKKHSVLDEGSRHSGRSVPALPRWFSCIIEISLSLSVKFTHEELRNL